MQKKVASPYPMRPVPDERSQNQAGETSNGYVASRPKLLSLTEDGHAGASEKLAYVAMLNGNPTLPDAMAVVDLDPASKTYSQIISQVNMPNAGDELHHFGWNACSSCLCPYAPHPHMERRLPGGPGLAVIPHSHSRHQTGSPKTEAGQSDRARRGQRKTGYSRAHTSHCGPDGIYMNALGSVDGKGPGGIFVLDPETFEIKGAVGGRPRSAIPLV